jgi:hypothetical protein
VLTTLVSYYVGVAKLAGGEARVNPSGQASTAAIRDRKVLPPTARGESKPTSGGLQIK